MAKNKATADSAATMVGRSIKTGVKTALKKAGSALSGGMAGKAAKDVVASNAKTKKAIDKI